MKSAVDLDQLKTSIHSASSATFLLSLISSLTSQFFLSSSVFASRASPSRSPLQASVMRRRLCRTSGIFVGSVEGVQEASDNSANDDTSRGCSNEGIKNSANETADGLRTVAPVASIICPIFAGFASCPASARICSYVLYSTFIFAFLGFFQTSDRAALSPSTFPAAFPFRVRFSSSLTTSPLLRASAFDCSVFSLKPLNAIPIFCGRILLSTGVTMPSPVTPSPVPVSQPIFANKRAPSEPDILLK